MYAVDDPMLALIVRFVAGSRDIGMSDRDFLQRQIQAIGDYVARFPPEEKNARALEWIEENAERYRRQWQREMVTAQLIDTRCPDCPLLRDDDSAPCEIHERWLEILKNYVDGEITSAQYVGDTLGLLKEHKSRLKVAGVGRRP